MDFAGFESKRVFGGGGGRGGGGRRELAKHLAAGAGGDRKEGTWVVGSIHTQPHHSSHPSVSFICAVFVCWMEEGNELFFFN